MRNDLLLRVLQSPRFDFVSALIWAAVPAAISTALFVRALTSGSETWRVVASGIGAGIFVSMLAAVLVASVMARRRSRASGDA